jgi:phospholipid/cholesterol/gamma-HCH transport system substrate-binding protein
VISRLKSTWIYKLLDEIPSFRDFNKHWVGAIGIALIVLIAVASTAVGELGLLRNQYEVSGVFPDTGGLRAGMDVRVAGVKAGEVRSVDPDFEMGQVVITWRVDSGVKLGPDTTAEIVVSNLLGGMHVRLEGPVGEPYLHDLPVAERRIPLERTRTPFSVVEAIDDTVATAQGLDFDALNKVVETFADATERSGEAFGELMTNLSRVTAAIGQRGAELEKLLTNSQQVMTTLRAKDTQLFALIDAADVLLGKLDERRDELSVVLGSGSRAVVELADLIAGQRSELHSVLADLRTVLTHTDRHLPALNEGLALTGPTFNQLAQVGNSGPWFDIIVYGLGCIDSIVDIADQCAGILP